MSVYLGAYTVGSTVTHIFTSRNSVGTPTALVSSALSPSVYKNGGTTQDALNCSLTTNFDSVAGLNMVVLNSGDSAAFYVKDSDYYIVLGTATVGVTTVTGETLCSFSLNDGALAANSIVSSTYSSDAYLGLLTASAHTEIAKSVVTASLAGSGVPHATRNVANALRPLRNKVDLGAASTVTIYAEDDSTSGWTGSVTTLATQGPISAVDPQS